MRNDLSTMSTVRMALFVIAIDMLVSMAEGDSHYFESEGEQRFEMMNTLDRKSNLGRSTSVKFRNTLEKEIGNIRQSSNNLRLVSSITDTEENAVEFVIVEKHKVKSKSNRSE